MRFATALRVPTTRIGAIIKEERGITPDTALRLVRYFGTPAQFWINLQSGYDLSKAQAEIGPQIERDVSPRSACFASVTGRMAFAAHTLERLGRDRTYNNFDSMHS